MKLKIIFSLDEIDKNIILKNISRSIILDSFYLSLSFLDKDILNKFSNKIIFLNFVEDKEISRLNKLSRGINKPTDCLSFPYFNLDNNISIESNIFGDIFIAFPYIKNQAKEYGVDLKYEIIKMFVHSLLHLFGFDHENEDEYKIMNKLEEKIMGNIEK